ncbi:MAG: hypothetical protein RRA45_03310, partial [Saccharolobus sp.]|nr:hypothetical protein [Saccharolobus sp.]
MPKRVYKHWQLVNFAVKMRRFERRRQRFLINNTKKVVLLIILIHLGKIQNYYFTLSLSAPYSPFNYNQYFVAEINIYFTTNFSLYKSFQYNLPNPFSSSIYSGFQMITTSSGLDNSTPVVTLPLASGGIIENFQFSYYYPNQYGQSVGPSNTPPPSVSYYADLLQIQS